MLRLSSTLSWTSKSFGGQIQLHPSISNETEVGTPGFDFETWVPTSGSKA